MNEYEKIAIKRVALWWLKHVWLAVVFLFVFFNIEAKAEKTNEVGAFFVELLAAALMTGIACFIMFVIKQCVIALSRWWKGKVMEVKEEYEGKLDKL